MSLQTMRPLLLGIYCWWLVLAKQVLRMSIIDARAHPATLPQLSEPQAGSWPAATSVLLACCHRLAPCPSVHRHLSRTNNDTIVFNMPCGYLKYFIWSRLNRQVHLWEAMPQAFWHIFYFRLSFPYYCQSLNLPPDGDQSWSSYLVSHMHGWFKSTSYINIQGDSPDINLFWHRFTTSELSNMGKKYKRTAQILFLFHLSESTRCVYHLHTHLKEWIKNYLFSSLRAFLILVLRSSSFSSPSWAYHTWAEALQYNYTHSIKWST